MQRIANHLALSQPLQRNKVDNVFEVSIYHAVVVLFSQDNQYHSFVQLNLKVQSD